jgi:chaperone modulatory protein CbpM
MSSEIVPSERVEFESFARVCDLHPELLERLVSLGLVEVEADDEGNRWVRRSQKRAVDRIKRLRSGLHLSYSSIAVVAPLLDRVEHLEVEVVRLRAEQHRPAQYRSRRAVRGSTAGDEARGAR